MSEIPFTEPLFLFGAGASRPFDIPTMKEMVSQFRDELAKSESRGIDDEIRLYNEVQSILSEEFENVDLESVFTVIDGIAQGKGLRDLGYLATFVFRNRRNGSLFEPPSQMSQEVAKRLRVKFEEFVRRVCWVKPAKLAEVTRTWFPFLNSVFRATGGTTQTFTVDGNRYNFNPTWVFFTTNYDNIIERLWRDAVRSFPLDTGFRLDPGSNTHVMDTRLFWQPNLRLLKLHGSVTWWKEEDTGRIVERDQPPDSSYIQPRFGERIMVYPIQQKDAFARPYFDLFYAFNQALQRSKRWLVIGYSFADEIIRAMLARASTPDTKLVLVHPNSNASAKMASEPGWSGQLNQLTMKFGLAETNNAILQMLR